MILFSVVGDVMFLIDDSHVFCSVSVTPAKKGNITTMTCLTLGPLLGGWSNSNALDLSKASPRHPPTSESSRSSSLVGRRGSMGGKRNLGAGELGA